MKKEKGDRDNRSKQKEKEERHMTAFYGNIGHSCAALRLFYRTEKRLYTKKKKKKATTKRKKKMKRPRHD